MHRFSHVFINIEVMFWRTVYSKSANNSYTIFYKSGITVKYKKIEIHHKRVSKRVSKS